MSTTQHDWTWDYFIAHAGPDKAAAEELFGLMDSDARVFLDSRRLLLGDDWDTKLAAAQSRSMITVVLVSSNTERAYYQREEIAAAIQMSRADGALHRVVPVFLDEGAASAHAIPYGLLLKHGLHLSDAFTIADAANELLALVQQLRTGNPTAGSASASPGDLKLDDPGIIHHPAANWFSPVLTNPWRYKVAAFDFDGTLMRGNDFSFSWEAVWQGLKFSESIQKKLKKEYRKRSKAATRTNRINAYRDWCTKACEHFKTRGLTRNQLKQFATPLWLTSNCREAMDDLRRNGVVIAIISGGLNTFLEDIFPDYRDYVDFVFINELQFTAAGVLRGVNASAYDFEGKADALDLVCERVGCTTEEAVFVGDHFNDLDIMERASKAIAYPPQDRVTADAAETSIKKDDLKEILPYVLVE